MTGPVRHRSSSSPDDESKVRELTPEQPATPSQPAAASQPTASPQSAGAVRDRLEQKLRVGRSVLATLAVTDDRARLLQMALMRRDEALLDGVLASLGVKSPSTPPPAR